MDLVSKLKIKNLLKKYRFLPSKRLGQNFLIDKEAIRKIIKVAELSKNDIVLEIGPGMGNLTIELAKRAKKVIAVEKDSKMIEILKKTVGNFENVKIIPGDILKTKLKSKTLNLKSYKVVANLPFYLTAPLIRKFLESREGRLFQMVLLVQKEVAQRICAKVPKMNLLAVSVQFYAQPKIISYISKKSFWPSPEVDAAIIKIIPLDVARSVLATLFFRVVRAGFAQPRKQLANNLSTMLKLDKQKIKDWLLENGVGPTQRAETLTLENWLNLAKTFNDKK